MVRSTSELKIDWTGGDSGQWRIGFPNGEFVVAREIDLRVDSRLETINLIDPNRLHGHLLCKGTVSLVDGIACIM